MASMDDAALKTAIVAALDHGPFLAESIAHMVRADVHAVGFALKRLVRAGLVKSTGGGSQQQWQLLKSSPAVINSSQADDAPEIVNEETDMPTEDMHEGVGGDGQSEDEIDELLGEFAPPSKVQPLRSKDYQARKDTASHGKAPHRQPPARPATEKATGTSSWTNAPREGFTKQQEQRVEVLRTSKQSSFVSGTPREHGDAGRRRGSVEA